MRRLALVLLAAAALAPPALAAFVEPAPYPRLVVPSQWEQRHAVAQALRRGAPVYCGGGRSNAVALTFDDGPGPYTEQLLRVLGDHGARATFFLVGNRLQYWPHAAREEVRLGVLGNHSWSHPRLTDLPRWLVWLELARTQDSIAQEVGWKPRLFRAPYELHDRMTDGVASALGLLEVFWSVDSGDDVPHAQVKTVVRNVLAGLHPGAIVLMHDLHPWTVAALPRILRAIRLRGLRTVTVPELLALDPPASKQHCPLAPGAD